MNRAKKLLFPILLLAVFTIALEGVGIVVLLVLNGRWVSPREVVSDLVGDADPLEGLEHTWANGQATSYMQQHILHPYLGFVRNPEVKQHEFIERTLPFSVNDFGFFGDSPMVKRAGDSFHVYLMGGSLALEFFVDAKDIFEEMIGQFQLCQGKKVKVIGLALGGHKQPQQVLLLNYLFSLGAEPDMVIALDGFNEVVLPVVENIASGVYPFFPRKWRVYGSTSLDMEAVVLAGAIATQRKAVDASKRFIRGSWLRRSRLGVAVWQGLHRRKAIERTEREQALHQLFEKRAEELPVQLRGPEYEGKTDKYQIAADCIDVWRRSSRQMWEICQAKEIAFMQFLQPNQYVEGSKVLTDWEKRNAFAPKGYLWRIAAKYGYPGLIEHGAKLMEQGVPYADLTDVYMDIEETIYKDICCHVNAHGAELLAERMAREIGQAFPTPRSP